MRTLVRELLLAGGMIAILVLAMWAHTGSMPPLVVVESSSMVHEPKGEIGSIDAGDLVLVHSSNGEDVVTFAEATNSSNPHYGVENHGMPGDVIIYKRNGEEDSTPIIHRAILEAKANQTTDHDNGVCEQGVYDSKTPGLNGENGACIITWDVPGTDIRNVESISISFDGQDVEGKYECGIDAAGHGEFTLKIVNWTPSHPGYVTLGDNNRCSDDQGAAVTSSGIQAASGLIGPVRNEWVIGISGSEIPWLGVVKLMVSGGDSPGISQVPGSSFLYLIILIGAILALPMAFDPIARKLLKSSPEMVEAEREEAFSKMLKIAEEE